MNYRGNAFHSQFERGRTGGEICVTSKDLIFRYDTGEISFPLSKIHLKISGSGTQHIYFTHPEHPEWKIFTSEMHLLKEPALQRSPIAQSQIHSFKTKKRFIYGLCGLLLMGFLFALYAMFFMTGKLIDYSITKIPVEWEETLGETVFSSLEKNTVFIENADLAKELKKITDPLIMAIEDKRYDFKFHIANTPTLNAFALPGGHVVINSGLILKAENPEEIAGVLAHEIAHVMRRHSLKGLVQKAGIVVVLQVLMGDVGSLTATILGGGGTLLALSHSRDLERDADIHGLNYLYQANINPNGMIEIFKKLVEDLDEEEKAMGETLSFLTTHPGMDERIGTIKKMISEKDNQQKYLKFNIDFKSFQTKLKQALGEQKKKGEQ